MSLRAALERYLVAYRVASHLRHRAVSQPGSAPCQVLSGAHTVHEIVVVPKLIGFDTQDICPSLPQSLDGCHLSERRVFSNRYEAK